jgi:cytochrome P450
MALAPRELLGHLIPAGTGLGVGIVAIHQDPELYPEPDEFRPDRFLERTYSPYEFMPFGGSHRRCLGAALSDFEMRVTLATIVSRWDFEVIGEELERRTNLATGPRNGVRMRLTGRR